MKKRFVLLFTTLCVIACLVGCSWQDDTISFSGEELDVKISGVDLGEIADIENLDDLKGVLDHIDIELTDRTSGSIDGFSVGDILSEEGSAESE